MSDLFEQATREDVKFTLPEGHTPSGELTVQQLWKLKPSFKVIEGKKVLVDSLADLEDVLQEQVEKFGKTSRRKSNAKSSKQLTLELQLAIVSHILDVREKEQDAALSEAENKAHNQKIYGLIAKQQEDELANLSKDELLKLIK